MSTKEKTDETEEATPGGKKKLLLLVLVILLGAAGAAYFFLFSGSGEAEAAAPEHGGYVALEPIAVNLAGGGYLKVGVTLEITTAAAGGGHGGASVDGSKALDLVISTFSQAAPADVVGAREALKEALKAKIIEAYTEHEVPMVMDIYYNEYVTQ